MSDPMDRLFAEAAPLDERDGLPGACGAAYLAGWSGALIFARRYPGEVDALERRLRGISSVGNPAEAVESAALASEALADDLAAGMAGRSDVLN